MSRIGRLPIEVPKGVTVGLLADKVTAKGPKGNLEVALHPTVSVSQQDGKLTFAREGDDPKARAVHGLMRALVQNMVTGVQKGWERKLEINGVGYRAEVSGNKITMQLGFSHPVIYQLPDGVKAKVEKNIITLNGADKQALGQAAANIRAFRPPEPYKGKGVKYLEERIIRKVGKTAG